MNRRKISLAERREFLIAQAAAQRSELAGQIEPWRSALNVADQGLAALRFVNIHPAILVGGVIVLAVAPVDPIRKWLWRRTSGISSLVMLWMMYRERMASH